VTKPLLEFMFQGYEVGYLEQVDFPAKDGEYEYEAYRGPGHYDLQVALKKDSLAECYYDEGDERVFFTVEKTSVLGASLRSVLKLSKFRKIKR